jgi:hypothetical protein
MSTVGRHVWRVVYALTVILGLALVGLGLGPHGGRAASTSAPHHTMAMAPVQAGAMTGMNMGAMTGSNH